MMRVVADENIPGVAAQLQGVAQVELLPGREIRREHLRDTDALLVRSVTRVDRALLEDTPVRFVGTATSGYDHVDREWLGRAGIGFAHAPGSNANSVVEYVLAAIAETGDFLEQLLAGGSVGIVGYGHIGRAMAARLQCLGIACKACDPWLAAGDIANPADMAGILASTVVTLHTSLVADAPWPSIHLLGADELAGLHAGQLLINASRGPVVDNAALLQRLQQPGAPRVVLDVWEHEPRVDPQLLQRVHLGTAHIAGYSLDGKLAATGMLCRALMAANSIPVPAAAPAVDGEALPLGEARDEAGALRELLALRYRVAEDDRRLREATLGLPEAEAAAAFDRLRKQYPVRRELLGSRVCLPPGGDHLAALVEALGAIPLSQKGVTP